MLILSFHIFSLSLFFLWTMPLPVISHTLRRPRAPPEGLCGTAWCLILFLFFFPKIGCKIVAHPLFPWFSHPSVASFSLAKYWPKVLPSTVRVRGHRRPLGPLSRFGKTSRSLGQGTELTGSSVTFGTRGRPVCLRWEGSAHEWRLGRGSWEAWPAQMVRTSAFT